MEGFYICKDCQIYYLFEGDEGPQQAASHKCHTTRVIFLVVVARPQWVTFRNAFVNGKLGCRPLSTKGQKDDETIILLLELWRRSLTP